VVQRVSRARVVVADLPQAEIGLGVHVLLGIADDDQEEVADRLAARIARLRIFENEEGKLDRSLLDTGGAALASSR